MSKVLLFLATEQISDAKKGKTGASDLQLIDVWMLHIKELAYRAHFAFSFLPIMQKLQIWRKIFDFQLGAT